MSSVGTRSVTVAGGQRRAQEQARLRAEVLELLAREENSLCAECGARAPRWASVSIGVFMCIRCSGIHRALGTHISQVRSVTLDQWRPAFVETVRRVGNERARAYFEANLPVGAVRPNEHSDNYTLECWMRRKYERREWVPKDGTTGPGAVSSESDDCSTGGGSTSSNNSSTTTRRSSGRSSGSASPAVSDDLLSFDSAEALFFGADESPAAAPAAATASPPPSGGSSRAVGRTSSSASSSGRSGHPPAVRPPPPPPPHLSSRTLLDATPLAGSAPADGFLDLGITPPLTPSSPGAVFPPPRPASAPLEEPASAADADAAAAETTMSSDVLFFGSDDFVGSAPLSAEEVEHGGERRPAVSKDSIMRLYDSPTGVAPGGAASGGAQDAQQRARQHTRPNYDALRQAGPGHQHSASTGSGYQASWQAAGAPPRPYGHRHSASYSGGDSGGFTQQPPYVNQTFSITYPHFTKR